MIITGRWSETDTSAITISAPGSGRKNVLQSINVITSAGANITVESPSGTTKWQTEIFVGGGGFDKDWGVDNGIFGSENSAMVISVSAGTYKISVNGVIVG